MMTELQAYCNRITGSLVKAFFAILHIFFFLIFIPQIIKESNSNNNNAISSSIVNLTTDSCNIHR